MEEKLYFNNQVVSLVKCYRKAKWNKDWNALIGELGNNFKSI